MQHSGPVSSLRRYWVFSSEGERFLHTEEVTGSIPVTPTIRQKALGIPGVFLFFAPFRHTYATMPRSLMILGERRQR